MTISRPTKENATDETNLVARFVMSELPVDQIADAGIILARTARLSAKKTWKQTVVL